MRSEAAATPLMATGVRTSGAVGGDEGRFGIELQVDGSLGAAARWQGL
jgi:hypothetical protein